MADEEEKLTPEGDDDLLSDDDISSIIDGASLEGSDEETGGEGRVTTNEATPKGEHPDSFVPTGPV